MTQERGPKGHMRRRQSRRTRSFQAQSPTNNAPHLRNSPGHSRSTSASSSLHGQFPEAPNDVSDWIHRRAAAGVPHRPLNPMSRDALFNTPATTLNATNLNPGISLPGAGPPTPGLPGMAGTSTTGATEVFELPTELAHEVDEDDEELAKAIAISLADSSSSDTDRYTIGGTNIEELSYALERSKFMK